MPSFSDWISSIITRRMRRAQGTKRESRSAPPRRVVLSLEALEERITPADDVGGIGGVVAFEDFVSASYGESSNEPAPGVLTNDQGTGLTASLVSQPTYGTVSLSSDGSFTYTHTDLNFAGEDFFIYEASDGTNSATANVTVQVAQSSTTTTLTSSAQFGTALEGEEVTFSALVVPDSTAPGAPTPTGTVVFTDSVTLIEVGAAELDSFGIAQITTSSLSVDLHTIVAEYTGSIPYTGSSGETTLAVIKAPTITHLTASPGTVEPNESITFTATITTFMTEAGTPTGTVEFREDATTLATSTVENGVATFTTSELPQGLHTITAIYTASSWFEDSSANQIASVGAGLINVELPDVTVTVQMLGATILTFAELTAGASTPNSGATLDPSTVTVFSQPAGAQASADPNTGDIVYTPGSLFSPPLEPENTFGGFEFRIGDSTGATSNIAVVRIGGIVAPPFAGPILTRDAAASTNSLQSVSINLLQYVDVYEMALPNGVVTTNNQVDVSSFRLIDNVPRTDLLSLRHGTASFDDKGVLTYTPEFGYIGPDSIGYEVKDIYGNRTEGVININVHSTATPRLQADPLGGTMLVVDGTGFADTITVSPGPVCGEVSISINGVVSDLFKPTSRIVVLGYGGADHIQVADGVKIPVWLVGGSGGDTLKGGDGPSVLLGGAGSDTLNAGKGRALLIGGLGADQLTGNGQAILVGGTTSYDTDEAALASILGGKKGHGRHHGHYHHSCHRQAAIRLGIEDVQDDGAIDEITSKKKDKVFATTGTAADDIVESPAKKQHHSHRGCRR